MAEFLRPILFLSVLISITFSVSAQSCQRYSFTSNTRRFNFCSDLSVLDSYLHWTYNPSSGLVDIAYRHSNIDSSKWVAWALNPDGSGMIGAQALVAYQGADGKMNSYTSSIQSLRTTLERGDLSFKVSNLNAVYEKNEMIIFATLELPNNRTSLNQVWQVGPLNGGSPTAHAIGGANAQSKGQINFLSGVSTGDSSANSRTKRKNTHGILSVVAWGLLMPIGAITARYLKVSKSMHPTWFYLHIAIQTSAYIIGVAGWGLGLKLGSESVGIKYNLHRNIGITLFSLATLQVFALLLRPKPDHKYRLYWNIYHHLTGYLVIVLSIVNIIKGFAILSLKDEKWKNIYIGTICGLGAIAVLLEAFTWYVVIKRKRREEKSHHGTNGYNGTNGVNAYGTRTQPGV